MFRANNPYSIVHSHRVVLPGLLGFAAACLFTQVAAAAQRVEQDLTIHTSRMTNLTTLVTGRNHKGIPVSATNGRRMPVPMDFLRQRGSVFGITDPDKQLVLGKTSADWVGHAHTTYKQVHKGVPVFSGMLKVHQNATGAIIAANGDFYPIPANFDTKPGITAKVAGQVAIQACEQPDPQVTQSQLVIVDPGWYGDPPLGLHLAYHVVVEQSSAELRDAFFVDALTGVILDRWSLLKDALSRSIHTALGSNVLPGAIARIEGSQPLNNADIDGAYDYAGDTYHYFLQAFSRDSIDDAGMGINVTVDYDNGSPNAQWDGSRMIFWDGMLADDVLAHEFTHGITDHTANLIYQNEPGQLNESFSDVFGELLDLFNGNAAFAGPPGGPPVWPYHHITPPGTDTPNNLRTTCSPAPGYANGVRWLQGEDTTPYNGAVRDMWDPTCFGHPDRATSTLQTCSPGDHGGVHSGSGIPNHAFAILTDGKTFNGYAVTGIGPIKAGAVWYRALTVYLTAASDFNDAFLLLNQAADDLIGTVLDDPRTGAAGPTFTAANAVQVENALRAVEMDIPGSSCLRGACCNAFESQCQDNVRQIDCPPSSLFLQGTACAAITPPCSAPGPSARMVVLLDRTGSMKKVRTTGNTRCFDALEQAKADVSTFLENDPGRKVAVWTFHNTSTESGHQDLTGGFVNEATALAALTTLNGVPCKGGTPLAEAICDAVDAFPPGFPAGDKVLALSTDGVENASIGPCSGPNSLSGPPYDIGSWQQKVLAKIGGNGVLRVRHWDVFGLGNDEAIDVESGGSLATGVSDAVTFLNVAGATGGTYEEMDDYGVSSEACCLPDGSCDELTLDECAGASGTSHGPGSSCTASRACCLGLDCSFLDPLCCAEMGGSVDDALTTCDLQACCQGDLCAILGRCECVVVLGGTPQGEGTSCAPEACCLPDDTCMIAERCECIELWGGDPQGAGTGCELEACCLPDGTCTMTDRCDCLAIGGTPHGTNTLCTVPEACCLPDRTCAMLDPLCCDDMGGTAHGTGTMCSAPEKCCLPDGTCANVDPLCCEGMGGIVGGPGTTCATEACCLPTGTCLETDPDCCTAAGGTPQGPGSVCELEACCLADGTCAMSDPICCAAAGGTAQGLATECGRREGCCMPDGTCAMLDPLCCSQEGGIPQGPGSVCLGIEACCQPNGDCQMLDALCCEEQGGSPQGLGTTCAFTHEACFLDEQTCVILDPNCCEEQGGIPQGFGSACVPEPKFGLVPVRASGVPGIDWVLGPAENQITLFGGGQLVALELTLSGWGLEELGVYQSYLDCATFDSADEGVLVPVTELCDPAQGGPGYDGTFCMGVDVTREDYALAEAFSSLPVCNESDPCPNGDPSPVGCASVAISGGGTDTGSVDYGAVFAVDVPVGASGTFVLGLDPASTSSFMRNSMDQLIEPLTFSPAVIMMGSGLPLIEPNDLVFGLSNSSGSDSMEQVRGPAVANGGTAVPDFWDGPFMQSVEFDNLDGVPHNPFGNLLGVDFGTAMSGGSIYSFATTIPEPLGQLIGDTIGIGGGGLTVSRLGGLSVSPDNSKIAATGFDSGRVVVYDYTAGDSTGFGASLSGARETAAILCTSNDTQGTTWVDNDVLIAFSSTGEIFAVDATTMATAVVAFVDVGLADPCGSGFTDIEFNPQISPYVYAMYGGFAGGITTNKLAVLEGTEEGLVVVIVITYSQSMDAAREIALDSLGNLFVSQVGSAIDFIPDAHHVESLADNSSINWYATPTPSSFCGIDVALAIPGELESPVLAAAPHDILKNRYISIDPRGADQLNFGKSLDIRLTLASTLVNGVTAVGSSWWANVPDAACISIVGTTRPAIPPNWDACPTLHLTGCSIIPTSTYDIVAVDGAVESAPPLAAQTQALPGGSKWWGDVVGQFDPVADAWGPPNGFVAIDDAVAAIKTFQNPSLVGPGCGTPPCNATHVSVTDVQPHGFTGTPFGTPNLQVDINDVFGIILGFQGVEFPGPGIEQCPAP